jgi:hypothetical protein
MAFTSASSLKLQVFSVMLSTSPLCTNPVTVFSNSTPTEVDFLATPTLGGGNPADGIYECVIIKMLHSIKFRPNDGEANCPVGLEIIDDVCQTTEQTNAPDSSTSRFCKPRNVDASDSVYLYLTTGKTSSGGGNAFRQPTGSDTYGLRLASHLVISGTSRAKFVVNTTGKVDGSGGTCGMNAPTFDFRTIP